MSEWVIKVSLPGYDVRTATPEQCAVHTKYDTLKIDKRAKPPHFGIVEITLNNMPTVGTTVTLSSIPHFFSFRPAVLTHFFRKVASVNSGAPTYEVTAVRYYDASYNNIIRAYTTDTQFIIDFQYNDGTQNLVGEVLQVRYYLFANEGN